MAPHASNPPGQDEDLKYGENVLFVWEHLELRAQVLDPDAIVCRGNGDLPSNAARFDDTGDVLLATPILSRTNSLSGQTAMTF